MKTELKKLETKNHETIAKLIFQEWKERGTPETLDWCKKYLQKGHSIEITKEQFFEIRKDNQLVGLVAAVIINHYLAELRDLVVLPEYRKSGIGKEVIPKVVEWCKENGAKKVHAQIYVPHFNWFLELGFKKEGELKDHFRKNEIVIEVAKEL
ncbi:GNAT family N-acetyltransferase [Candidatus Micrarchaeota archaeon]|nr:GNAT family N-acetyltransferase [Candidatus Micrarchaeota archaeon]MBU1930678.1 GNAT family N-acetyltransferase [Candidatus Micrarchaeota archaeon]